METTIKIKNKEDLKYLFANYVFKVKGTKFNRFVNGHIKVFTEKPKSSKATKHDMEEIFRFTYDLKGYDAFYVERRQTREKETISKVCPHLVSGDRFTITVNKETYNVSIENIIDRHLISFLDKLDSKYGISITEMKLFPRKSMNCSSDFLQESIERLFKHIKK